MPNWVESDMRISGLEAELDRFLKGIIEVGDKKKSILDSYFPTPEELKKAISGTSLSLEQIELQNSNVSKYGYPTWYEWNKAYYGTKWSDNISKIDDSQKDSGLIYISFETPWSFPKSGFVIISKLFPELWFKANYYEQGMEFCGAFSVQNGEVNNDQQMKYYGQRGG